MGQTTRSNSCIERAYTMEQDGQEQHEVDNGSDDGANSVSTGSSDANFLAMLGLDSLHCMEPQEDEGQDEGQDQEEARRNNNPPSSAPSSPSSSLPKISDQVLQDMSSTLQSTYERDGVCIFPSNVSISAEYMRRLTEELVWGGDHVQADKTYETITIQKRMKLQQQNEKKEQNAKDEVNIKADGNGNEQGESFIYTTKVEHQRKLTRLENFVDDHVGWSELCHVYLRKLVSSALGEEMVLYKEKLNLKPSGGSGFAPHLDTPSLRIALGGTGPQTFCTVMVAIDDMTISNGCLRVVKGKWSETNHCPVIEPEKDGNPDAGGRAGAIPLDVADGAADNDTTEKKLNFEPILCKGGTIVAFNGWVPHRSSSNTSPFARRAVFLTYNPKREGDFHRIYYETMEEKRRKWRESVGLLNRQQQIEDERFELEALATIPNV